jgi:elongation of very long chain fatty acids protein 7
MERINTYFENYGDQRVKNWFLMSSPVPSAVCCILFVLLVKKVLPSYMKNRNPMNLRNLIQVYNAVQVIANVWLFNEFLQSGWLGGDYIACEIVTHNEKNELRLVTAMWWYYIYKFIDFFDTFFFVLRKKDSHVTVLHLFHHASMPFSSKYSSILDYSR